MPQEFIVFTHPESVEVLGWARPGKVQSTHGTWQLVRVVGWQHDGSCWRCLLQWGVEGVVYEGWYLADPERLAPVN
jgi:hypothetical protein